MPGRPYRNRLRGHAADVIEAVINTAGNPFAQFTRISSKPSPTKRLRTEDDIPDRWPKKVKTLPNLRQSEQMSASGSMDGQGSGKDQGLKETEVDDPFNIQRGPPDYAFATLPYVQDFLQGGNPVYMMREHQYRMTSPYDVLPTINVIDLNAGTGTMNAGYADQDANDTAVFTKARWFDFYASAYKYYHVVACRWHATFENQMTQPLWLHQYYQNDTVRPTTASNVDMMLWKDTKSYYVGPVATAVSTFGTAERVEMIVGDNTENAGVYPSNPVNYESSNHITPRGPGNILQLSGEYRPGDFDREIRLDNLVENWTAVNSNPALAERLVFRIKPQQESQSLNSTANIGSALTYRLFVRIEYLVEFKELKDGLKYPINSQPATLTVLTST